MTLLDVELELTITLTRVGPPGGDWRAVLERGGDAEPITVAGPMPGPLLEELGADLDLAELTAAAAQDGR